MNINKKFNFSIITISIVLMFIGFLILNLYADQLEHDVYNTTKDTLQNKAIMKIQAKKNIGITNAISITNDERIQKSLEKNNRDLAISSLENISTKMKKNTPFKNVRIHIHNKNSISFVRNWDTSKYGDDLSSFRASVVKVNAKSIPITTFEVGNAGLSLRAIACVLDDDGKPLGSLEFMQGVNSVAKIFDKRDTAFLLLMDETLKRKPIPSDKQFKNYGISQRFINNDFVTNAKNLNMNKLFKDGYLISDRYFYTFIDIKDFQDKKLGIALLGKPLSIVNQTVDSAKQLINISMMIIIGLILALLFLISILLNKVVITPIKTFHKGLDDFFMFLQNKKDDVNRIEINSNDEFGQMAHSLNENIAVSAKLHEEIHELNVNLEERIEEKTTKVTTLLNNAGQGFLTFDGNFIIDDEYSKECEKYLGDNIAFKDISNILFTDIKKAKFFKEDILDTVNTENKVIQKSMLSLLPNELILNKRALKLEYRPLKDKKMMLILTNISAQKKLEKRIKKEQDVLKMIVTIIGDNEVFYDVKHDFEYFIVNNNMYINMKKTSLHNINDIYRTIHTFKGSFLQLGMNITAKHLHSVETQLSEFLSDDINISNEELLEFLSQTDFKSFMQNDLDNIVALLGKKFLSNENKVSIDKKTITNIESEYVKFIENYNVKNRDSESLLDDIRYLTKRSLYSQLNYYPRLTLQTAKKLEKEVYEFEVVGDKNILISEIFNPFLKSLIHLFRNSVDHGIETAEQRAILDKDETGTIACSFNQHNDNLQIIISDDGAGINVEKIKAIISKHTDISNLTDADIYQYIFKDNMSTKDEVTETSGRGVGMSAVKAELDKLNGIIKIQSELNIGTTFVFDIPLNNKKEENENSNDC